MATAAAAAVVLPRAVVIYAGPLTGEDVLRAVTRDVAQHAGSCDKFHCFHDKGACSTCICRTLIDLCCYRGPPPFLYPQRLRSIYRLIDHLKTSISMGLWQADIEMHRDTVRSIYQRMGQDVPLLVRRALDLPSSIMHSPVLLAGGPAAQTMMELPRPVMLTTATGQPLSPLSSRPVIYAQHQSYQQLLDMMSNEAVRAVEMNGTAEKEVESVNALDSDEVGHIMDPIHVERAYQDVARGSTISFVPSSDNDDDGCVDL